MFKRKKKVNIKKSGLTVSYLRRFNSVSYTIYSNSHRASRVIHNEVTGTVTIEVYKEGVKKPIEVYIHNEVANGKAD